MPIHPSAIVHPTAELADDVEVQPFSIIEDHVTIGAGTVVGPHCVVGRGTVLGRENRLFSGAQVGVAPQDLKHLHNALGKTIIGDRNVFREFVTISSSTVYSNEDHDKVTSIGSGCLFMSCTHVAHDCIVGDGVIMANQAVLAGHVTVEDRVIIGGLTGVHQFCVLGTMSFIGGMARINKDVPPYMILEGSPARCFGPNTIGLQRNGLSTETIKSLRQAYRLLYRSGLNTSQALERIKAEIPAGPERDVLVGFYQNSQRGVH